MNTYNYVNLFSSVGRPNLAYTLTKSYMRYCDTGRLQLIDSTFYKEL